jgi:DNA repair exonuclease SbcCD ATPase subunit
MTSDPELTRRVERLENDRDALYELVTEFRTETLERFEQVDRRFEQVDQRFEQVDRRFEGVDQRLEGIDQRLVSLGDTLVEVLRRLPEPS